MNSFNELVLAITEFNKDLSNVINKYSKIVPATVMLDKIVNLQQLLSSVATKQLDTARKEKEVAKNG